MHGFLHICDCGRPADGHSPPAKGGWTTAPEGRAEKPGLDRPLAPGGMCLLQSGM